MPAFSSTMTVACFRLNIVVYCTGMLLQVKHESMMTDDDKASNMRQEYPCLLDR